MDKASYYIKSAIPLFRKNGLPIIWIQHIDEDDRAKPGEVGFEIIDALVPEPNDYRVRKMYGNSFNKTNLMEILEKNRYGASDGFLRGVLRYVNVQRSIGQRLDADTAEEWIGERKPGKPEVC